MAESHEHHEDPHGRPWATAEEIDAAVPDVGWDPEPLTWDEDER